MKPIHSRFLFALAAVVQLTAAIVAQVQSTGAVPGDEFQAAGFLYGILGPLSWVAAALVSLAAVILVIEARMAARIKQKRRVVLVALAAISMITAFVMPLFFAIAALLILAADEDRERARYIKLNEDQRRGVVAYHRALADLSWRNILKAWTQLAILASLAAFTVAVTESFTYSASFAGWLFGEEVLVAYRLRLVDLAITFGATISLLYVVPMILDRFLRSEDENPWRALLRARMSVALVTAGFCAAGLFAVIGDEIYKTGVLLPTMALVILLFTALARLLSRNLVATRFADFEGEECTRGTAWGLLYLFVLGLPLMSIPGRLGEALRTRPAVLFLGLFATAVVWEIVLLYLAYPELEDFRSRLILLSVITAVNVFVLAVFALGSAMPRIRRYEISKVTAWILAALLLFGFGSSFRPLSGDVALVVNEYSRFGFMMKKSSLRELIRPVDDSGESPAAVEFEVHGEGEDKLPQLVPGPLAGKKPPIVVILWDAARPDHMGCYGYERPTTPNLDKMASESVIFDDAYSGATATTAGVRHLFTGKYSSRYMLSKKHHPFFVHALREQGYRNFLITATGTDYNGVSLESFQRGGPLPSADGSTFQHLALHPQGLDRERPDSEKTENVIHAWRRLVKEKGPEALDGSLTFLHLTGAHFPWRNANAIVDFGTSNIDLYDGEMAKVDALSKKALDTLKELGVYDDAIVILVADHGTGLREHGRWAGFLPYQEQIRVPLIMKIPGVAPRRVKAPVSTIDVAPTLLGILDPGGENRFDGVSLLPMAMGRADALERRYIASLCAFEDAYALIENSGFKLHFHRRENYSLLFDLKNDAGELVNLYDRQPEDRDRMLEMMRAFLWRGKGSYAHPYHYRGDD